MSDIDSIIDSILNFSAPAPGSEEATPRAQSGGAGTGDAARSGAVDTAQDSTGAFAASSPPLPATRGNFPLPPEVPTQAAARGIAFDFNNGARVLLPEGRWHVTLTDIERKVCLYAADAGPCTILGSKKYFIPTRVEIRDNDTGEIVLDHTLDCRDRDVAIAFPGGTLGDAIAWFSYAAQFQEKHDCHLAVIMSEAACKLFAGVYPRIRCCTFDEYETFKHRTYATYYMGLFFTDENADWQPSDFRLVGLHHTAAHILGLGINEKPPRIVQWPIATAPLDRPYVAIATQASSQCKYWNNPHGWSEVIRHLNRLGYDVVCIDRQAIAGHRNHWNYIPHGARDETGERPLAERAYWIRHAAFFIGLSSGLSWLAWATGTPVVMISGFTHPLNEFETPYRVFNPHVCNSCWHDIRVPFQHDNPLFCPRHEGTPRHFECTRLITADYVTAMCDRVHAALGGTHPDDRDLSDPHRSDDATPVGS
ncbi:autotransporter strand-loop-strand O-heptosyltransferase [Swaminathania salitolerans]|uniref:Autotransporter strand-loop-strand O-heptosyltransferase n=1 Tax=Swaminathania salitolerans TaxID=182838 RepID=A0A511BLD5_9PROT|nr:autotransporter strand-loop-strand O-heptosyltransferase [Swaminathania salitolerans]GBQ10077.1 glycosyltransferase [Swaminathania salitolerans LMG 21291]GEL01157.1 autotransporter strand-loop-strand O-heptosyltransferase [Swaminathania salitolerans]